MNTYINANEEAGKAFYLDFHQKGKIVLLNLLKFKSVADYTDLESLKPAENISGKKAYSLYMKHTLPLLDKAGSKILFSGNSGNFLIGPQSEQWDEVLLVEHASVAQFIKFSKDATYLKTVGHRTAALEDARLLPISR